MKHWLFILLGAVLSFGMVIENAEAKRMGGGRSLGSQRQVTPQQPAATPAKPARQADAAPAAQRSGMSRWLAPLAGLAIGLGLASLFGEEMGSIILLALIAFAVIAVVRMLMTRRAPQRPMQTPQGMQYQGLGRETDAPPFKPQSSGGTAAPDMQAQFSPSIPEGFDVDGFVAQAKRNFLALQTANDRGDLDALREMMSDELYTHIRQDIDARSMAQQTDVVTLDAQLLEVVTEGGMHWASIRFSGMLREETSGNATRPYRLDSGRNPAGRLNGVLSQSFTAGVNHLLGREAWARERLLPFAGKCLRVRAGFADVQARIGEQGLLEPTQNPPDLQLDIPAGAWFGLMRRDEAAMRAIQVQGVTELAATAQDLFLHLRWDVAEDLSRMVGDVAAQRIVDGGRAILQWQRDAAQRLGENLAEYWGEESRVLATRGEAQSFGDAVATLRDDLARLEKRLERRETLSV
jgi:ubiquinone biosynthesis protein UbiJ/predicted lipid-binding transport protein (Tim44 family)